MNGPFNQSVAPNFIQTCECKLEALLDTLRCGDYFPGGGATDDTVQFVPVDRQPADKVTELAATSRHAQ